MYFIIFSYELICISKDKNKEIITVKAVNQEDHQTLLTCFISANNNMKIDEKRSFAKSFHRPSHGEKTYQESPHQTYSIENSLYIDKDFLKNNIGESLITLKAKYIKYLNYTLTQ